MVSEHRRLLTHQSMALLIEIARCPEAAFCLANPTDLRHPCADVVRSQGATTEEAFHIPEPWNGAIERAPILFLSSNPAFGPDEDYPTGDPASWPDDRTADFFTHRFGGGREPWTRDGCQPRQKDGSFAPKKSAVFWNGVGGKARDILGREDRRGEDWALTEVVHCKSNDGEGVARALARCSDRYLIRVVAASGAGLLACLGRKRVWPTFLAAFPAVDEERRRSPEPAPALVGPIELEGRVRYVAFLEHPGAGSPHLSRLVSTERLAELREFLSCVPGEAQQRPRRGTKATD